MGAAMWPSFAIAGESIPTPSALTIDFSVSQTNPVTGEVITFSATVSGNGTALYTYNWTFGDGTIGSDSPVTKSYSSPGTYTVSLTVTDSSVPPMTETTSKPIDVTSPLGADFSYAPAKPQAGDSVSFSATATGGTSPFAYSWNWGDGTPSGIGQSPTHTYASAGTFTVTLTVTDSASPAHTATPSNSVAVTATLTADFSFSPSDPVVGQTVSFAATASGGTQPYTYSWIFGDGTTGTGQSVGHAFPSPGTFTVTLTITDSGGPPAHTATRSRSVTVISALAADFSFSPSNPVVDQPVSFAATASGGTSPYTYEWDFGDGTTLSGRTRNHAYSSAGTFTVTLTVTDNADRVVSVSKFITVTGVVSADFTFTPANPVIGQPVSFSATASGGTPPYSFSWAFGDGSTGSGQTASHSYISAGDFTVTLTVSDSASHVTTVTKVVSVAGALVADFTFSPTNPAVGQSVTFTASASGGTPPYTYAWNFGDGGTGSGPAVSHSYSSGGSYPVTLTVTDSRARTVTMTKSISVATLIVADFTYFPAAPSVGEMVTFSATASGGTTPYTYSWTFGDGGAGQGQVVSRPYASAGTFTVILTVTDIVQRSTTVSKSIVITPVLAAGFTFAPTNPVIEEVVTFTATASGGTPPYTISWTFGDGGTGMGGTANHAYASSGNFTAALRVDDSVGHTVTVSQLIPVTPLLRADFTYLPSDPVVGEDVDFTATTTGGTGPYTHEWSFGDESTDFGREVTHAYASVGSYTVVLTVSDSVGHEATATKVVPVRPALDTTLTVSQERPITGEVVQFTANATGGTPPYTYRWEFGDGSNATGATAFYAYPTDGSFEVVATATDASGRRGVARMKLLVTPALSVNFTPPLTVAVGDVLLFSAIVEGGTEPYNVTWTFGDGGTGVGPEVNHTFASSGIFNVTVTVSDSANHTFSRSKVVAVAPPLSASARYSPPRPAVGEEITFSANATGGTPPYWFNWTFGDGNPGAGPTVTYFYVTATTYNVTLNITDFVGRSVALRLVVVTITNLRVDFAFDPGLPITGRPIAFLPTVSGGVPPFVYAWAFGDGSSSTEERPTHLYEETGLMLSYTVELTVCDAEGHCVTASKGVTLVDWPQIANIGVGIAIVSVVALWLVRRHRAGELNLKPAGRWAWRRGSGVVRGIVGRVRGLRNGRGR